MRSFHLRGLAELSRRKCSGHVGSLKWERVWPDYLAATALPLPSLMLSVQSLCTRVLTESGMGYRFEA